MVAKCFTKLDFTAGACSTQRAESLNATVKRFIKVARRTTFLKLVDCFEFINDAKDYQTENINRLSKIKHLQTEDHLLISLSRNYSPYIVSKINEEFVK